MHHTLEIHEILLNILERLHTAQLVALVRTCRLFKEPALDLIWGELLDLSPLARCLPDATHLTLAKKHRQTCYAFSRPPTQIEWNTLRSYTRRIRSIQRTRGLGRKSFRTILDSHTTEQLFPNLQRLRFTYTSKTSRLLRLPLPSIISLDIDCFDSRLFQNAIASASKFLSLRDLSIRLHNLERMHPDTLVQLSSIRVTRLEFNPHTALARQLATSNLPQLFPHLLDIVMHSQSLPDISGFLSETQLPAVTTLGARVRKRPSNQDVSSFVALVKTSGISPAFHELSLLEDGQLLLFETMPVLGMKDFRSCMVFNNIRRLQWNIQFQVDLTDNDMLTLASAWPCLEQLLINEGHGWKAQCGITPHGLVRLLRARPSLNHVALALDTRDFSRLPLSGESLELSMSHSVSIDFVDSTIEEECVPAIADFLVRLSPRFVTLKVSFFISRLYFNRWRDVQQRIEKAFSERS